MFKLYIFLFEFFGVRGDFFKKHPTKKGTFAKVPFVFFVITFS